MMGKKPSSISPSMEKIGQLIAKGNPNEKVNLIKFTLVPTLVGAQQPQFNVTQIVVALTVKLSLFHLTSKHSHHLYTSHHYRCSIISVRADYAESL